MKLYLFAVSVAGIISLASAVFHQTGQPEPNDRQFIQVPVQQQVAPVSVSPATLRSIRQAFPVIRYAHLHYPGDLNPLAI